MVYVQAAKLGAQPPPGSSDPGEQPLKLVTGQQTPSPVGPCD
jgi:hypothetical protein